MVFYVFYLQLNGIKNMCYLNCVELINYNFYILEIEFFFDWILKYAFQMDGLEIYMSLKLLITRLEIPYSIVMLFHNHISIQMSYITMKIYRTKKMN